jgi:hypothetical protein
MKKAFVLAAIVTTGMTGCASGGGDASYGDVQVLAVGNHSSMKNQEYKDFHNAADFDAYMAKAFVNQGSPPKLDIDWTKQMVLTGFIGAEKNTGYRIRFLSVDETGDTVSVHVRIVIPCMNNAKPDASEPFAIVAAPATSKPVNINDPEQEYQKC